MPMELCCVKDNILFSQAFDENTNGFSYESSLYCRIFMLIHISMTYWLSMLKETLLYRILQLFCCS